MSIKTSKRIALGVIASLVFAPFAAVAPASAGVTKRTVDVLNCKVVAAETERGTFSDLDGDGTADDLTCYAVAGKVVTLFPSNKSVMGTVDLDAAEDDDITKAADSTIYNAKIAGATFTGSTYAGTGAGSLQQVNTTLTPMTVYTANEAQFPTTHTTGLDVTDKDGESVANGTTLTFIAPAAGSEVTVTLATGNTGSTKLSVTKIVSVASLVTGIITPVAALDVLKGNSTVSLAETEGNGQAVPTPTSAIPYVNADAGYHTVTFTARDGLNALVASSSGLQSLIATVSGAARGVTLAAASANTTSTTAKTASSGTHTDGTVKAVVFGDKANPGTATLTLTTVSGVKVYEKVFGFRGQATTLTLTAPKFVASGAAAANLVDGILLTVKDVNAITFNNPTAGTPLSVAWSVTDSDGLAVASATDGLVDTAANNGTADNEYFDIDADICIAGDHGKVRTIKATWNQGTAGDTSDDISGSTTFTCTRNEVVVKTVAFSATTAAPGDTVKINVTATDRDGRSAGYGAVLAATTGYTLTNLPGTGGSATTAAAITFEDGAGSLSYVVGTAQTTATQDIGSVFRVVDNDPATLLAQPQSFNVKITVVDPFVKVPPVPVVVVPPVAPTLKGSLNGRVLLFGACQADEGDLIVYVKSPGKLWQERAKTFECAAGEFDGSIRAPKSTKFYRVKQEGTGLWSSSILIRP